MFLWLWLPWIGCSGEETPTDTSGTETGPPTLPDGSRPVAFLAGPTVRPNLVAGLTAWLDVTLDDAASLEVEVEGPDRTFTLASPAAEVHTVLLAGLRRHRPPRHRCARSTRRAASAAHALPLTVTTDPLPDDFVTWEMGPGDEPPGARRHRLRGSGDFLVAVDPEGHPSGLRPHPGRHPRGHAPGQRQPDGAGQPRVRHRARPGGQRGGAVAGGAHDRHARHGDRRGRRRPAPRHPRAARRPPARAVGGGPLRRRLPVLRERPGRAPRPVLGRRRRGGRARPRRRGVVAGRCSTGSIPTASPTTACAAPTGRTSPSGRGRT
ncbi:MAG: hypothetical protein R3F59_17780 [Myxococcota bacterium]